VSRASQARRIAVAAAYGGGSLGLLTAGAFGLIRAEAALARRAIGEPTETPPEADGLYGSMHGGKPISFVVLGDSSAGGLGVEHGHQTPGAMMAASLAEVADRPVQLTVVAVVGAQSSSLDEQIDRIGVPEVDVAVIMIGVNDVTHRVSRRPRSAPRPRRARLRDWAPRWSSAPAPTSARWSRSPSRCAGSPGAPAGQLAARRPSPSSRPAAARVSLGDILGPEFAASPSEMFGPDRLPPVGGRLRQRRGRAAALAWRRAGRLVRRRGGAGPT
jgi:hypothetical protein